MFYEHNPKMAIHIQSGKNLKNSLNSEDTEVKIQYMPFKISADCEAKVSSYFTPYVKSRNDSNYSASFRGYPLVGQKISLTKGYTGAVLQERIKAETETNDRKFFRVQDFDSFMYWNWDKVPSKNDPLLKALNDWIDLAEALHSPIEG